MLKHDAYVAVGVGQRRGFPVVLRPEGAGATGDLAWQSWGRFGRRIGRRCRDADAHRLDLRGDHRRAAEPGSGTIGCTTSRSPATDLSMPNGVPGPATPWQPRPDWHAAPRAVFVGRLAPGEGARTADRRLARRPAAAPGGPADPDRRGARAARSGGRAGSRGLGRPDQPSTCRAPRPTPPPRSAPPTCSCSPRARRG